jgi:hypothetical protein
MFEVLSNKGIGNVHTKNGSSRTVTAHQKLKATTSKIKLEKGNKNNLFKMPTIQKNGK